MKGLKFNKSNLKTLLPIAGFILIVVAVALWFISQSPKVDTTVRYGDRLKMAEQANEILLANDELSQGDSDIEQQLTEQDYNTLLGIDDGTNSQEIANEYAMAQETVAMVAKAVAEHEAEVREHGGIADVEDLHALDILPITDKERRATILQNLGTTDEEFNENRAKQKEQVAKQQVADEVHDHEHSHDHHDH